MVRFDHFVHSKGVSGARSRSVSGICCERRERAGFRRGVSADLWALLVAQWCVDHRQRVAWLARGVRSMDAQAGVYSS